MYYATYDPSVWRADSNGFSARRVHRSTSRDTSGSLPDTPFILRLLGLASFNYFPSSVILMAVADIAGVLG